MLRTELLNSSVFLAIGRGLPDSIIPDAEAQRRGFCIGSSERFGLLVVVRGYTLTEAGQEYKFEELELSDLPTHSELFRVSRSLVHRPFRI